MTPANPTAAAATDAWIDLHEELPPLNRIVLVWLPDIECTSAASLMPDQENRFVWSEMGAGPRKYMTRRVSHWQPYPKGPKP